MNGGKGTKKLSRGYSLAATEGQKPAATSAGKPATTAAKAVETAAKAVATAAKTFTIADIATMSKEIDATKKKAISKTIFNTIDANRNKSLNKVEMNTLAVAFYNSIPPQM